LSKQIQILYEDDGYIVFDKPSGLLVIPTPKNEKNTLVNIVNEQYADKGLWNLHPCHRLDKETSGAIIFAKGKHHQKLMMELFKQRLVSKKYIAFVHGQMAKKSGEFHDSIRRFGQNRLRKNFPAQSAMTQYKVIEERKSFSVVEVKPITGRNNQIRIHFSKHGRPLVGDRKYAFQRDYELKFRRTALHAMGLEWRHPMTHQKINVQSGLPNDMEVFLGNNRDNRD